MSDLPSPTSVGKLIRRARKLTIPSPGIPEVAHRAGIDPGTLGNIERGYRHLGGGRTRAVPGEAETIAKVASILGITPEQLETEGERPDAAEALRATRQPSAPLRAVPDHDGHGGGHAGDASPESVAESLLAGYVAEYPSDRILQMLAVRPGAKAETRLEEVLQWIAVNSGGAERNGTVG